MVWLPVKFAARLALVTAATASLAACATIQPRYPSHAEGKPAAAPGKGGYKVGKPYQVGGVWYTPREQPNYDEVGTASWYGNAFHLKATANGELFDMNAVTAAHTTLPLPSLVEVTNLENGRKLKVRVNDRGPFVGNRIIDLSYEAARQLGFERKGLAQVRVRYLGAATEPPREPWLTYAKAQPVSPPPSQPTAIQTVSTAPAPAAITSKPLAPLTGAALPALGPGVARDAPAAVDPPLRIQAGAFSTAANAQRAVEQLAGAGEAFIEPLQRDGHTLYRVLLSAPADEAEAYALRERVAEIGFADARVVKGPS